MKRIAYKEKNRIVLEFDYDCRIIALVKTLDGRQYHPGRKVWSLPIQGSDESIKKLLRADFKVSDELKRSIKDEQKRALQLEQLAKQRDVEFDSSLPLYPYQKVGAKFLRDVGSGLLGDEMGLGKTVQVLAVTEKANRVLIICPAALKYQWAGEIKKFLGEEATVIDGPKEKRIDQWTKRHRFTIMNYELLIRDDFKHAGSIEWDYILADEATKISNSQAKQSKAIKKLNARHRIAMTGTPVSNRAHEIWNICDFIAPGSFGNYWSFQNRYCIKNYWGAITQYQNLEELNQRLKRYMIRRIKEDVALDLPDKIETDIPIKLSDEERKLYKNLKEEILFDIDQAELNKIENPTNIQFTIVKMLRLMQLVDSMELLGENKKSSKLEALDELLAESLD